MRQSVITPIASLLGMACLMLTSVRRSRPVWKRKSQHDDNRNNMVDFTIHHDGNQRIKCLRDVFLLLQQTQNRSRNRRGSFMAKVRSLLTHGLFAPKQQYVFPLLIEDFCEASLSWVKVYASDREHKAKLFCDELMATFDREGFRPFPIVAFLDYAEFRHANLYEFKDAHIRRMHTDFDGLLLSLCAGFDGAVDPLTPDVRERTVALLSLTYGALQSSIGALLRFADEEVYFTPRHQLEARIVKEQLNALGLTVKEADLGNLRACLISTPFESSVRVNRGLSPKEFELACFHELAHAVLRHSPGSCYALDPGLMASAGVKDQYSRQELEADAFANLWSYVLNGVMDFVLATDDATLKAKCRSDEGFIDTVGNEPLEPSGRASAHAGPELAKSVARPSDSKQLSVACASK